MKTNLLIELNNIIANYLFMGIVDRWPSLHHRPISSIRFISLPSLIMNQTNKSTENSLCPNLLQKSSPPKKFLQFSN